MRNIDVVPRSGFRVIAPVIVGPACDAGDSGATEQVIGSGERCAGHVVLSDQGDDFVTFVAPAEAEHRSRNDRQQRRESLSQATSVDLIGIRRQAGSLSPGFRGRQAVGAREIKGRVPLEIGISSETDETPIPR